MLGLGSSRQDGVSTKRNHDVTGTAGKTKGWRERGAKDIQGTAWGHCCGGKRGGDGKEEEAKTWVENCAENKKGV